MYNNYEDSVLTFQNANCPLSNVTFACVCYWSGCHIPDRKSTDIENEL